MAKPRRRKKSHGYQIDMKYRGQRLYKTFASRETAEAWERQQKDLIDRGEMGHVSGKATFAEAWERFEKIRKAELSATTWAKYEIYWNTHFRDKFGAHVVGPRAGDVREWIGDWRSTMAASTVATMLNFLRALCNVAIGAGLTRSNPCAGVRVAKGARLREIRYLEDDEIQAVVEACRSRRERIMVLVGLNTGLRLGELMAMAWEWIDFQRHVLRVPASIEAGFVPKGKRTREVPLNPAIERALMRALKSSTGSGRLVSGANWRRWAAAIRRRAAEHLGKIRQPNPKKPQPPIPVLFRWHLLRHTAISRWVMAGVPLTVVKDWAGHASINTTMLYAHLAPEAGLLMRRLFVAGIGPVRLGKNPKKPTASGSDDA